MTASFISLFGIADNLSSTANVIREIANDIGHGTTPRADLLAEITDLESDLARLKNLAAAVTA